jgi:serine/threonine-protein kinase RsbW
VTERLSLRLAPLPASIPIARSAISEFCRDLGLAGELADRVRLAVTEACTNVVLHAYDDNAKDLTFTVHAIVIGSSLAVTVRDAGKGIRATASPLSKNAGRGFGMQLMAQMASSVDVVSRPGVGTRIALRFRIV